MATCYLLNSPVLTAYGDWQLIGPLSIEQAQLQIADGFTSAIGHEGSAQALAALLGIEVPVNRVAITMQAGDIALVLRMKERLPEGVVLNAATMKAYPWELSLLKRVA